MTGTKAKDLETKLRRLVIGQEEAIHEIVRTYQTYLAGLSPEGRPIGNFLFLGPTGTGKTRAVEATAEALLGNPRALIKIDCGEFQHSHEIAKLVGSPPGYLGHRETHPMLAQEVLNQYHTDSVKLSFVLFDEIEKASDALWNMLLGILDNLLRLSSGFVLGSIRSILSKLAVITESESALFRKVKCFRQATKLLKASAEGLDFLLFIGAAAWKARVGLL